jgi:hypothetical protein
VHVGRVEASAGELHRTLLIAVTVWLQQHFNAVAVPRDPSRLAVDHLRRFLQTQTAPSESEIGFGDPVVQVGEQKLQVQHDLVFLQVTFPTQGLGVNRITECSALEKASAQLVRADLVAVQFLKQTPLSLAKAPHERIRLSPQSINLLLSAGGGLPQTLATLNIQSSLRQLVLQITTLDGVGVLQVGQTLAQIMHGSLTVGQLSLGHCDALLGSFPLSLTGTVGTGRVSISVVDVEIGLMDQVANAQLVARPTLAVQPRDFAGGPVRKLSGVDACWVRPPHRPQQGQLARVFSGALGVCPPREDGFSLRVVFHRRPVPLRMWVIWVSMG